MDSTRTKAPIRSRTNVSSWSNIMPLVWLVVVTIQFVSSDAFGSTTDHRHSATMTGVPKVLVGHAGVAGYLLPQGARKSRYFPISGTTHHVPAWWPFLVGGSKVVPDNIILLENLITKVDKLMIGGATEYTFLKALGCGMGTDMKSTDLAKLRNPASMSSIYHWWITCAMQYYVWRNRRRPVGHRGRTHSFRIHGIHVR